MVRVLRNTEQPIMHKNIYPVIVITSLPHISSVASIHEFIGILSVIAVLKQVIVKLPISFHTTDDSNANADICCSETIIVLHNIIWDMDAEAGI